MQIKYLSENQTYSETTEPIRFDCAYDVIVSGLGAAGSFAAISAAGEGVSVLGIERSSACGGISTRGAIPDYYYGHKGGLFEEVDASCKKASDVYSLCGGVHIEAKKFELERHLTDAGVDIRYESVIVALYFSGDRVIGVKLKTQEGIRNISCKILVDATSDGHLLRMTGIKTNFGRSSDGKTVPFTSVMLYLTKEGKLCHTNTDAGYTNQYDAETFSRDIIRANSHHLPQISNREQEILGLASQIGVREGIRFDAEDVLTLRDVTLEKQIEKPLIYAFSDVDKHGIDTAIDEEAYQDWIVISNFSTLTVNIPLPLGSVVPKNIKGLFSAGRCLGVDSYLSSAIRMNRDMYRLGEAVGILSASCVKENCDAADVNYEALKNKLISRGCFNPTPERHFGFSTPANDFYRKVTWLTDINEIKSVLSTDTPSVAIWSCKRLGKKIADDLYSILQTSTDEMLKYHSALALGFIGDERALPTLREIAENRSSFFWKDCRRSNQLRSVITICLLGRFGDKESIDILSEIVFSKFEYEKAMYHEVKPQYLFCGLSDFNNVYFQHFSHALAALYKIGMKNPECKDELFARLRKLLSEDWYIPLVTTKGEGKYEYQTIADVRKYFQALI